MIGRGAISTAGHDIGKCYVICREDTEYVYLVDGIARTLKNPKKKSKKHTKLIGEGNNLLPIMNNCNIMTRNEDIKRAVKTYRNIVKGEFPQ